MPSFLHVNVFTLEQTMLAAGIAPTRGAQWLSRGFQLGDPENEAPGRGRQRLFSAARATQIAIAGRLIGAGVPVVRASEIAAAFNDINAVDGREPGTTHADDITALRVIFTPDGDIEAAYVSHSELGGFPFSDNGESVLLIDVSHLERQVQTRLGITPDLCISNPQRVIA